MDIEIVSGFLGAGKTTFLKQYLPLLTGKTVVIENEYGEIGLDGDLIQSDIPVKELYAGCICCSLAVDFRNGIREIVRQYQPDRIVIEPSGVGKLSDIVKVCEKVRDRDGVELKVARRIAVWMGALMKNMQMDLAHSIWIRSGRRRLFSAVRWKNCQKSRRQGS